MVADIINLDHYRELVNLEKEISQTVRDSESISFRTSHLRYFFPEVKKAQVKNYQLIPLLDTALDLWLENIPHSSQSLKQYELFGVMSGTKERSRSEYMGFTTESSEVKTDSIPVSGAVFFSRIHTNISSIQIHPLIFSYSLTVPCQRHGDPLMPAEGFLGDPKRIRSVISSFSSFLRNSNYVDVHTQARTSLIEKRGQSPENCYRTSIREFYDL